jgi:hypothetical protein
MASIKSDIDAGRNAIDIVVDQFRNLLMDPDFFCIVEEPGPLTDFALASRLSYLLWNSTPDEQLLEVARQGKLRDSVVLREQSERMLADPKGKRFYKGFASQWLRLAAIDDTTPDPKLFPEYHRPENDLLKWSSVAETETFLALLARENASVRELVDSRRVLANASLARHYGLPDVFGSVLREIKLPEGSPFGGLWTQPAVMKVTANGTNTSPVKRGVFVAERLLGVHIPPPPPNIEPISSDTSSATSLKEKLALHAGKGSCAACHAKFDGYGFALESFDPVGTFREFYRMAAESTVAWKGDGKGSGTWGGKSGDKTADWSGGMVPAANDHIVISGSAAGAIAYNKPLYDSAAKAVFAIALGNQTAGETTRLETSADFLAKRVFVGPGGHWLHRAGTVAIADAAAFDGGEVEVAGGDFCVGQWPAWKRLEISRGGKVNVTGGNFGIMDLALPNTTAVRQVIGSVGEGALAVSGSSRLDLRGIAQVGNGPNGRGEVVLDTSTPIRSASQWDVQHGRLVIGKNSGLVSCESGTPPKQACYRIGLSGAAAVLDKLGDSEITSGYRSPEENLFFEVGPMGTVNWHGGGMLKQAAFVNAGTFNYLDTTGTNAFYVAPLVNAAGGRFHWRGAAGISMYKAAMRNDGLLSTGHDGQVTLLADLVLEKSGTFCVGLGAQDKAGIVVGNREGGSIKIDGRLEIAPLALPNAAENKLGGRTFTILTRGKDAPAITGTFSSTSDDIAKVDYSDDAVTVTIVENPSAKPTAEPTAAAPVTFAEVTRLDAAALVAAQRRTPNWTDDRPAWRNHLPVESAGTLPDGRPFADIKALRKMLSERPEQLAAGVASHLVTYGTGMRPLGVDNVAIETIVAQTKPEAYGFRSLLHSVIQSELFRTK